MRLFRQRGFVTILVAIVILPLLGFLALVIDFGRARLALERTVAASESAAMAGVQSMSTDTAVIQSAALAGFSASFGEDAFGAVLVDGADPEVTVDVAGDTRTVTVTANVSFTPLFLQIFGRETVAVQTQSRALRVDHGPGGEDWTPHVHSYRLLP